MVDCRDGPVPLDQDVAKRLRYVTAPVLLVVNKVDTPALEAQADEFYRFGRKIVQVSAKENRGKAELLEAIAQRLPEPSPEDASPSEPVMKVAIVGRRNVGKSTLVNTLAQAERMIVSEVPGTTRDSVDVRFELDGKAFMAIDTPGFRRSKSINTDVEFYSTHRAQRSIRRADVVLLFFDATPAHQQGRQAIVRLHRPAVQTLHVRGQQVGLDRRRHAHREMGALSARQFPHHGLRADRVHHRPDGQERQGDAQPLRRCSSASRSSACPRRS